MNLADIRTFLEPYDKTDLADKLVSAYADAVEEYGTGILDSGRNVNAARLAFEHEAPSELVQGIDLIFKAKGKALTDTTLSGVKQFLVLQALSWLGSNIGPHIARVELFIEAESYI